MSDFDRPSGGYNLQLCLVGLISSAQNKWYDCRVSIITYFKNTSLFSVNPVRFGFLLLLLGITGVLAYEDWETTRENAMRTAEIERLTETQQSLSKRIDTAILILEQNLDITKSEQELLRADLMTEKQKATALQEQLGQVSGTVNTLEKLTNTDEELLQKYSKVYFLNEHYIPSRLLRITPAYVYDTKTPKRELQIHASVWPYLKDMMDAADKTVGSDILIVSAYRSFGTQEVLKAQYTITYGTGANTLSADQGYSEHQLGTTVDFTAGALGLNYEGFANTKAFAWLVEHAHLYGFTLSYSKNNAYYQYEPWHWRFVGKDLATKLFTDRKHFYDLDQREIDTYLVSIFD